MTVRLYAAAAHAAGLDEVRVSAESLPAALTAVAERAADRDKFLSVLGQCSILIEGVHHEPAASLSLAPGVTVDVLPPFAGG